MAEGFYSDLHAAGIDLMGHVDRTGAPEHWWVTRSIPAFVPASRSVRISMLLVLIGVPREDGKMKASGLGAVVAERHHSSSVSIEDGSQT